MSKFDWTSKASKWCLHKYRIIGIVKLDDSNEIQHRKCLKCGDDAEILVERGMKQ